jgi:hypothetical protein
MADPVLTEGQYSIGPEGSGAAFVYGGRWPAFANAIQVAGTQIDTGTIATQDQPVVGHDGQLFGVDTMPGMVVTQTGQAYAASQAAAAMDAYAALAGAWNTPSVRLSDNTVVCLRAFYPGSNVVRRCYGRGRQIVPVMGTAYGGMVGFTAAFQAADGIWYEDALSQLSLSMAPVYNGGLTPPLTPPYQLAATANYGQNAIMNYGPQPTWPVITFRGPVSYPGLTYVNTPVSVGYQGVLGPSDRVVIDTRPWARTARLNGTASVAGALTGDPMIALQAQPGATVVRFTGQDYTGKGQCIITWRSATLSIGGSQ